MSEIRGLVMVGYHGNRNVHHSAAGLGSDLHRPEHRLCFKMFVTGDGSGPQVWTTGPGVREGRVWTTSLDHRSGSQRGMGLSSRSGSQRGTGLDPRSGPQVQQSEGDGSE